MVFFLLYFCFVLDGYWLGLAFVCGSWFSFWYWFWMVLGHAQQSTKDILFVYEWVFSTHPFSLPSCPPQAA